MKPGQRVLITGATSGLGREMALQCARAGAKVAVTGRRSERLQETLGEIQRAGGEGLALVGGVENLLEVKRHYETIAQKWGGLDWAILNAGTAETMNARQFSAENCRRTFSINVFGVANWLEMIIPGMIAQGGGTIAGIASIAAFRGLPNGAYSASKAALVTLLESVRVDLHGTGVSVVTVCPGYVKSEMTGDKEPGSMPFLLETEDGARRILNGIEKGARMVAFPWQLSLPVRYLLGAMPGFIFDRLIPRFMSSRQTPRS